MGEDDFQPRQVGVEQHVEEQRRRARHPRVDRGQRIEQAIAYRRVPVGVPDRVLRQCPCESLVALVAWRTCLAFVLIGSACHFPALTRESMAEECQRYDHAQRDQRTSRHLERHSYRGYPPLQSVTPPWRSSGSTHQSEILIQNTTIILCRANSTCHCNSMCQSEWRVAAESRLKRIPVVSFDNIFLEGSNLNASRTNTTRSG